MDAIAPRLGLSVDGWLIRAARQQLQSVVTGVGDWADPNNPSRLFRLATADAADEAIDRLTVDQQSACQFGDARGLRVAHNRRQSAVYIEQQCSA